MRAGPLLVPLLACAACVHRESTTVEVFTDPIQTVETRTATNLPARFDVVTPAAAAGDCPPQLRDPDVDTTLRLQRSVLRPDSTARYRAIGDYAVEPRGVYGERAGEGVRVDCARLRAIGIVTL